MKDPIRLLESSPSELERQMLASMANETVPPELVTRMSAGIGLTLSSGVGLSAAHTALSDAAASKGALAGAGAAGKTSLAPTAWTLGSLVGTKLTIGLLSTALVATSVAYVESGDPRVTEIPLEPAPAPLFQPMTSVPRVSVSQTRAEPVVQANTEQKPSKADSVSVVGERPIGRARAAAIPSEPASAGHVALEVSLLDQARGAITSGDRQQAMALLSRYRAKFPNGVLLNEAKLLTAAAEAL